MDWTKLIGPAIVAIGSGIEYSDKKKRQKELNAKYDAYKAAIEAGQGSGGGSRSGGGGGGGGKSAMRNILSDYYAQANAALEPYAAAAKQVLPSTTEAYKAGLSGFGNMASQTLDPEYLRRVLNYQRPQEAALPDYLMGAKK